MGKKGKKKKREKKRGKKKTRKKGNRREEMEKGRNTIFSYMNIGDVKYWTTRSTLLNYKYENNK